MTIMDLVNKKEQIDRMSKRIRDTIAKTDKGFESINKFEKSTDEDGKKAINLARISTNELIMDLNECQKQLREYSLQNALPWNDPTPPPLFSPASLYC